MSWLGGGGQRAAHHAEAIALSDVLGAPSEFSVGE